MPLRSSANRSHDGGLTPAEMPIYEYACPQCGTSFEELIVRRADEAAVKCPSCGAADVSRQMSRPAAVGGGGSASASPAPRACGPIG